MLRNTGFGLKMNTKVLKIEKLWCSPREVSKISKVMCGN